MNYKQKYLKYKTKYLKLKQSAGAKVQNEVSQAELEQMRVQFEQETGQLPRPRPGAFNDIGGDNNAKEAQEAAQAAKRLREARDLQQQLEEIRAHNEAKQAKQEGFRNLGVQGSVDHAKAYADRNPAYRAALLHYPKHDAFATSQAPNK